MDSGKDKLPPKETYGWKYLKKIKLNKEILRTSHLVHSFLTIMLQVLIYVSLNVFPYNASREISPCMPYPSLASRTYCQATIIQLHYSLRKKRRKFIKQIIPVACNCMV